VKVKQFIPGKDFKVPDSFEVTVKYLSGRVEKIEAVERIMVICQTVPDPNNPAFKIVVPMHGNSYIEFLTVDDLYKQVVISTVESFSYNLDYTRMIDRAREREKERLQPKKKEKKAE